MACAISYRLKVELKQIRGESLKRRLNYCRRRNRSNKVGLMTFQSRSKKARLVHFARKHNSIKSKYSWKFFKTLAGLNSQYVTLWLAELDNKSIAGAITLGSKQHVAYGFSAAKEEFFELRPVNLLLYEMIKDAHAKQYKWFDLCPSGGHEGVANFKKSFGAVEYPTNIINSQPQWLKSVEKIYKALLLR